jgi:hypothetical protein
MLAIWRKPGKNAGAIYSYVYSLDDSSAKIEAPKESINFTELSNVPSLMHAFRDLSGVKRLVFLLHLAFWVLFFVFKYFDYRPNVGSERAFLLIVIPGVFNLVVTYVHYFALLPFLLRKQYLWYALLLVVLLGIAIPARGVVEAEFLTQIFNTDYYTTWTLSRVTSMLWNMASFLLFIALIKFTVDRFELVNRQKTLENEKLTAELNYLKAQINPHFLFNTLHNLNYLAEQKSDQATGVIMKLSYIMRYMIYEAHKPAVRLEQEISYIRDYLDLEAIRLNNTFDLTFSVEEVDTDVHIAPLLLIPLVENAFKHGISDQQSENWITICMEGDEKRLRVEVANSLKPEELREDSPSGFGLENLRRRLELAYPGRHTLDIDARPTQFCTTLTLAL